MVSEQAVDGHSPLDTMIQRLQQEQDQRRTTNDVPAATAAATANNRASRGKSTILTEMSYKHNIFYLMLTKRLELFIHVNSS